MVKNDARSCQIIRDLLILCNFLIHLQMPDSRGKESVLNVADKDD